MERAGEVWNNACRGLQKHVKGLRGLRKDMKGCVALNDRQCHHRRL